VFAGIPENTNEVLMDILRKAPEVEVLEIPGVVCFIFFTSACNCYVSRLTIILFLSIDLFSDS